MHTLQQPILVRRWEQGLIVFFVLAALSLVVVYVAIPSIDARAHLTGIATISYTRGK